MRSLTRLFTALAIAACFSSSALAQSAGAINAITPMTRDTAALITLTAQGAGTVNSADQSGFNVSRVACVFRSASQGAGTPSTTFSIQNKDTVSGQYYSILTSAAVTTSPTTNAIFAGAGVAASANVGAGVPLSRNWRVTTTTGGGTPSVTGTVSCSIQ